MAIMLTRICVCLALLAAQPVWSQAGPDQDARMLTPPPVSGEAYPTLVGSEMRLNYLAAALILNTSHDDNILAGGSAIPIGDVSYSVWPTITLNVTTPRQQRTLTYSPRFTFYQHTSTLNAADQNAALNFQYRLSEHTTISLNDSFQKFSNIFNQPYPVFGGAISGSALSPPIQVVAPYAGQISNTANMGLSYQLSTNGMMGLSGIITQSNYASPADAAGLYNSNSLGGSAFYSQRLSNSQYVGLIYQYEGSRGNPVDAQANPANTQIEVRTHTLLSFYTIYLNPMLSLSFSGGPQHVDAAQAMSPPFRSWMPSAKASVGWQRNSTNFVASYSRAVTGNTGLPGAFSSSSANASVRLQITPTLTIGSAASYAIYKNVTPLFSPYTPGGHTVSGTVSVEFSMSDHFRAELGYVRLHQSYSGIVSISNAPDSNREYISLSYQFARPLGR